jgi:hypothetical protein
LLLGHAVEFYLVLLMIELGEGFRQPVQRSAEDLDIVFVLEVWDRSGLSRHMLQVLAQILATAAQPLVVLELPKEAFCQEVGVSPGGCPVRPVTRETTGWRCWE